MPMKLEAVFLYRVAIARHSLRRAQSRSTWLRLAYIHSGQAGGASFCLDGIAGRAPRSQMCSRNAWLLKPRSATPTAARRAGGPGAGPHGAAHGLGPALG